MQVKINLVPTKPGVYMWLDKHETILYIGKAKNLKKRMGQYFTGMLNSYKTAQLVKAITNYKYIITKNEKEALILERNLIHKHIPPYNILLTDDKRYPYIRVKLTKKLEINLAYRVAPRIKNTLYFGPFPFGYGAKKLMHLVQRLTIYEKGLPIVNKDHAFWVKKYRYAQKLLSTQNSFLINELEQKMRIFAANFQYELAADIKSNLEALKQNQNQQLVQIKNHTNIDVIAFSEDQDFLFVAMLFYRNGALLSQKQKTLAMIGNKNDLIRQFVGQYYQINMKPHLIISNHEIETSLKVLVPKKGTSKQILELALANARDNKDHKVKQYQIKEQKTMGAMRSLELLLGIEKIKRIVMIDNSNTNNFEPVSGIISYVNGAKRPREYRKFALQIQQRKADVDYLNQGLTKYFKHHPPPIDLLIVDGGKAQINEARKIVPSSIIILGLIKDPHHKTKALLNEQGTILDVQNNDLWLLLTKMQAEVDLYAKSYHHKRRHNSLEGVLITVPGIGPKSEQKLLAHFKNYAAIYNASRSELEMVVSKKVAAKIKEMLNENNRNIR